MESNNMKNIVVLKDLPSNLVEEAIVILKANQKVKDIKYVESKNQKGRENKKIKNKGYLVKEAEMLISGYLQEAEEKKKKELSWQKEKIKHKRLKKYSLIVTIVMFFSLILNFI